MNESTTDSLIHSKENQSANLADVLREVGVFVLSTAKRAQLATTLLAAGLGVQSVREIAAFIAESEPEGPQQRRYLAALLSDTAKAREAADNIEAFRLSQSGRLPAMQNMQPPEHATWRGPTSEDRELPDVPLEGSRFQRDYEMRKAARERETS